MQAELIFSGTELLLGQIVNTNAIWLQRRLAAIGIDVYYQVTVGDNRQRLAATLAQAGSRANLVICSGGLGPTNDDLTREALADVTGLPLVTHPGALEAIEAMFNSRGWTMPASNRKQALVPRGGIMLPNPIGTAPGILLHTPATIYVLLPGPPRELAMMFQEQVEPRLQQIQGNRGSVIRSRVLRTCGIGEADLDERLNELTAGANPTLAPLAQPGEVHLRVTAKASSVEEADLLITGLERQVRERVGSYIYGIDEDTLEAAVGHQLRHLGLRLAVAESCSGGLLGHRLTNVPGSSDYLDLVAVVYQNRWKQELLQVPAAVLEQEGAVSEACALAMAAGIRRLAGTDIGMAVTGIAGPGGGSEDKPVGLVYLALDMQDLVSTARLRLWGERLEIKERAAQSALVMLWRRLQGGK